MTRLALALLTLLLASGATARASAPDPAATERLAQANDAFARAVEALERDESAAAEGFRVAAGLYASIVDQLGVRSSDVLTNAGNARYLAGDTGRAIALYHRALRLDPADDGARSNLEVARARVAAAASIEPPRPALEAAAAWRLAIPLEARLVLALLAWSALWLALGARLLGVARRPASLVAWPALAILAIAGATLAVDAAVEAAPPVGVVIAAQTTGRTGPDAVAYPESFTAPLPEGVEFTPIQSRPGWVQARFADGRESWLRATDVTLVTH